MSKNVSRFTLWSILGRMIALHDAHDFGKFDHLHHWLVGVLMTSAAEVANLATSIMQFKSQAEAILNQTGTEVKELGKKTEDIINTRVLRTLRGSQEATRQRTRQRIY